MLAAASLWSTAQHRASRLKQLVHECPLLEQKRHKTVDLSILATYLDGNNALLHCCVASYGAETSYCQHAFNIQHDQSISSHTAS